VAIILHDQDVKTVAGRSAIVADWKMLFAEYPIVGEKFQRSDKFV
jgi:hypothetical protein